MNDFVSTNLELKCVTIHTSVLPVEIFTVVTSYPKPGVVTDSTVDPEAVLTETPDGKVMSSSDARTSRTSSQAEDGSHSSGVLMTPPIYARVQHRCAHLRMPTLECSQHRRCPSSVVGGWKDLINLCPTPPQVYFTPGVQSDHATLRSCSGRKRQNGTKVRDSSGQMVKEGEGLGALAGSHQQAGLPVVFPDTACLLGVRLSPALSVTGFFTLFSLQEAECAYTLFVVAIFWLTEALPLSVTALLPGLMFPLFGIMSSKAVASAYFKDFHLLLIGVICLATSIEKWNLHKRIALRMVMMVGVNLEWQLESTVHTKASHFRLTLGFMISTAFLSMWLSNTSTAAMVMPIVEAVTQQIISAEAEVEATQMSDFSGSTNHALELDESINGQETNESKEKTIPVPGHSNDAGKISSKMQLSKNSGTGTRYRTKKDHMMCKLMCLCIAYSSTVGGLTTITGTSTNLIFSEHFNMRYPECRCINFGSWFMLSFPAAIILLLLSWIWLQWLFLGFNFKEMFKCGKTKTVRQKACAEVIKQEYQKLGPIRYQEIVTLILFIVMALLWFSRDPGFISGWSSLFPEYRGFATDSTVALLVGLLFFLIPAKRLTKTTSTGEIVAFDYSPLITWKEFQSFMPWDIAILVGGGFALADGCEVSGLSKWIANQLSPLGSLPGWLIILISSLLVTSLTEVASNPATITLLLPILSPLAEAIHMNPLYILIPSTLCTSFAFLLPVANPPNAIVFSYGHLKVIDMHPNSPIAFLFGKSDVYYSFLFKVKAGLGINIMGVAVVMLGMFTWITPMFDLHNYPSWAPPIGNETTP
ncbi:Solute carrier family 13 member 1 [Galemys pyrenaicus]|uniref:Solute carrier family 13 member 1 n=1 Tax=Galemys pyrenaicus TaxID=202257 RepID=A0A8J6E3Q9_GALPY|nr:Solute carrier family 13 member 1 [Galemys pyrenaicus]